MKAQLRLYWTFCSNVLTDILFDWSTFYLSLFLPLKVDSPILACCLQRNLMVHPVQIFRRRRWILRGFQYSNLDFKWLCGCESICPKIYYQNYAIPGWLGLILMNDIFLFQPTFIKMGFFVKPTREWIVKKNERAFLTGS